MNILVVRRALPTELVAAFSACHMIAATIFLDPALAFGTLLGIGRDEGNRGSFITVHSIQASCVLFAGFFLVPWSFTSRARLVSASGTAEDIAA